MSSLLDYEKSCLEGLFSRVTEKKCVIHYHLWNNTLLEWIHR